MCRIATRGYLADILLTPHLYPLPSRGEEEKIVEACFLSNIRNRLPPVDTLGDLIDNKKRQFTPLTTGMGKDLTIRLTDYAKKGYG